MMRYKREFTSAEKIFPDSSTKLLYFHAVNNTPSSINYENYSIHVQSTYFIIQKNCLK